jgi:hypothetical protein
VSLPLQPRFSPRRTRERPPREVASPFWLIPMRWYGLPRPPERPKARQLWLEMTPTAPIRWWQEAIFVGVETSLGEYGDEPGGWTWKKMHRLATSMLLNGFVLSRLHAWLEQRRARQLGLTIETVPAPVLDWAGTFLPLVVWESYRRVKGLKARRPPFTQALARRVVKEVERRRQWREVRRVIATAQEREPSARQLA